jgi:hypothetical protein
LVRNGILGVYIRILGKTIQDTRLLCYHALTIADITILPVDHHGLIPTYEQLFEKVNEDALDIVLLTCSLGTGV